MLWLDVHGIGVGVDGDLVVEEFFRKEYGFFKRGRVGDFGLFVEGVDRVEGAPFYELVSLREGRRVMWISLGGVSCGRVRVLFERGLSPAFVVYMVEPVLAVLSLLRGRALIHACCVTRGDRCLVFPSWGGTGKTSVVLYFLSRGYGYMGDDWVFVGRDGCVYAYPRRIRIYSYNLRMFPWLRERLGDRFRLFRMGVGEFLAGRLPWRYARIAVRKLTPYYPVCASDLFPGVEVPRCRRITHVFFMRKSCGVDRPRLRDVSVDEVAGAVSACFMSERAYFLQFYWRYAFHCGRIELIEKMPQLIEDIVREAFRGKNVYLLELPMRYDIGEVYSLVTKATE